MSPRFREIFKRILPPRIDATMDDSGMILCAAAIGAFNLLFFNKFFALPEAWFSLYAKYLLAGRIPYKDFYLFIPPLHPIIIAGFVRLFGDHLILLRTAGFLLLLVQTMTLYRIFLRFFSPSVSMLATVFSTMIYENQCAFSFYDYNDFVNLYTVLLVLAILRFMENRANPRSRMLHAFAVGVLSAVSFLTKQTVGLLSIAVTPLLLSFVDCREKGTHPQKSLAAFFAGLAAPSAPIVVWLSAHHALGPFLQQVFVHHGGKGRLLDILFRWLPNFLTAGQILIILNFAVFLYNLRFKLNPGRQPANESKNRRELFLIFSGIILCIFIPYYARHLSYSIKDSGFLWALFNVNTVTSVAFSIGLLGVAGYSCFKNGATLDFQLAAVAVFSNILWFCAAMSAGLYVPASGTLLASGLSLGLLIAGASRLNYGKSMVSIFCLSLIAYMASFRFIVPYGRSPYSRWWGTGDQEDIREADAKFEIPELEGFRVGPKIAEAISGVENLIEQKTQKNDYIFCFPHIPLFYFLSGRRCPTFSIIHWYDVVDSATCGADADALVKTKPRIIVWLRYKNDDDLRANLTAFQNGVEPDGHRLMMKALTDLTTNSKLYRLVRRFDVESACAISVFARVG